MSNDQDELTLAEWKQRAREVLQTWLEQGHSEPRYVSEAEKTSRRNAVWRKYKTVLHPITLTVEDVYGGVLTCTYDISRTLVGLTKQFEKYEVMDEDICEYAKEKGISIAEARARVALRYVEAEMFGRLKAARFLHDQLAPAVKHLLGELLDGALLQALHEYGIEIVEPAKMFEQAGRSHIKHIKQRSGLVRPPGRPRVWTKAEVLKRVNAAMSKQKEMPSLRSTAQLMNYGDLSGGESALGKLLKKHGVDWKELKREWKKAKKRK
jgi:hypothetical protein